MIPSFLGATPDHEVVAQLGLEQPLPSITLKAPQIMAYHWMGAHPRAILALDKGMGKTIVYLTRAIHSYPEGPIVIACPKNAFLAQLRELSRHFPETSYSVVTGQKAQRARAWKAKAHVYITTLASFKMDLVAGLVVHEPKCLVCDEFHRGLRGRKTATFQVVSKFTRDPHKGVILSSGSALGRTAADLWSGLHVVAPKTFSSYWLYTNAFCEVNNNPWGRTIEGYKNPSEWRRVVGPHLFRRKKDLLDYPPKTRMALDVEMDPWQQKLHDDLLNEMLAEIDSGATILALNKLAALHKVRMAMICPKALDESLGWGAALEAIHEDALDLTHFVVSTPYREGATKAMEFFQAQGRRAWVLSGALPGHEALSRSIAEWTAQGGVMIQTIAFAESYELPAARNMYMLGCEYSPASNSQAEDRIHRDLRVTPDPVNIYYIRHRSGFDAEILERLAYNADTVHTLLDSPLKALRGPTNHC